MMSQGLDRQRLEELETYFRESIAEGRIQGACFLAARDDEPLAHRALGKLTFKEDSPALPLDAIGDLFEMTMLFTATAVLQLVEKGALELDRPVSSLIPEFDHPYYRSITVFHLLTHTSGLIAHPNAYGEAYTLPHFDWHPYFKGGNWLRAILSGALSCRPGELCAFSTAGYAVLGAVVEAAAGVRFEDYVRENILRPLRLEHTFFTIPQELRGRAVAAFDWQLWSIHGEGDSRVPRSHRGLYSTLADLWRFGRMMLNGGELDGARILKADTVELMTTNRLSAGVPRYVYGRKIDRYRAGFGWELVNEAGEPAGEDSYFFGNAQCGLYIDPREWLIYAFFAPNASWNFEEANAKPRAIVRSAVRRPPASERLADYFGDLVRAGRVQGAGFLLSRNGETLAQGAFGKLRYHSGSAPLTSDSLFYVSSLTKLITAICVLQLEEEGTLSLSQPAKEWLPEFDNPQHGAIEIGHLLRHTSGLSPEPGLYGEPNPNGWWESLFLYDWEKDDKRLKWVKAILAGPLHDEPGRTRLYSTAGYTLLGEIVARASGMPYETYADERVFGPLGMRSTLFDVPDHGKENVCLADEWQEQLLHAPGRRREDPPRSGAGMVSTLGDLGRLGQALLDGNAGAEGAALSGALVHALRQMDFLDVPGFAWTPRQAAAFPCGPGRYPVRQMEFPMPLYHDASVNCGLIVNPEEATVAVFHVPSSVGWSPEPMAGANRILLSDEKLLYATQP